MSDLTNLKNRIIAALSVTGKTDPYVVLNQELSALAMEVGNLTTTRNAQVRFDLNGHAAAVSLSGLGPSSKFMLQTDQVGRTPFSLRDASESARMAASAHIPELCEKLLQTDAQATESVAATIKTIRWVRRSITDTVPTEPEAVPPKDFAVEEVAQELTAEYVHNLRVRYEGLLELVRNENERLNKALHDADQSMVLADQAYDDLFNLCESVFCGSQGDPDLINTDALNKLKGVVRKRAHEHKEPA